jgi:hypothetical protein
MNKKRALIILLFVITTGFFLYSCFIKGSEIINSIGTWHQTYQEGQPAKSSGSGIWGNSTDIFTVGNNATENLPSDMADYNLLLIRWSVTGQLLGQFLGKIKCFWNWSME